MLLALTYPSGGGDACCMFVILQVLCSPAAMVPVGQLPEKEVKKSCRGTSFIEYVPGPNVTRVPLSLPWNKAAVYLGAGIFGEQLKDTLTIVVKT